MFPAQYLVPSFLTRAVLCAGKEAWKRRPFLLSSQICSNYRITSICGSLAAFSLPPPPLSSPVFSLFPSPLFHLHSPPLFLFFFLSCFFIFGGFFSPSCTQSIFFVKKKNPKKPHSLNKVYDNQNILAFLAKDRVFW